ncbi:MAG TPA: hypothetical protein VMU18_04440, partial [Rhodoblastus sp.]|nr:hypothetical protein [Rhodoblastus sp.]
MDFLAAGRLRGWAARADLPRSPVVLQIFVAGILLGETRTSLHRPDLDARLPGNVAGFDVSLIQWGREKPLAALEFLRGLDDYALAAAGDFAIGFAGHPTRIDHFALG